MDVCDEKATGEDGSVSQHDDHSNTLLNLDYHMASEFCFRPLHPDTGAPLHFHVDGFLSSSM